MDVQNQRWLRCCSLSFQGIRRSSRALAVSEYVQCASVVRTYGQSRGKQHVTVVGSWHLKRCFASSSTLKGRLHRGFSSVSARLLCHADEAKQIINIEKCLLVSTANSKYFQSALQTAEDTRLKFQFCP